MVSISDFFLRLQVTFVTLLIALIMDVTERRQRKALVVKRSRNHEL